MEREFNTADHYSPSESWADLADRFAVEDSQTKLSAKAADERAGWAPIYARRDSMDRGRAKVNAAKRAKVAA